MLCALMCDVEFVCLPCVWSFMYLVLYLCIHSVTHPSMNSCMLLKFSLTNGMGVEGQTFNLSLSFAQEKKGPPTHTLIANVLSYDVVSSLLNA